MKIGQRVLLVTVLLLGVVAAPAAARAGTSLQVSISDSPDPARVGDLVVYEIEIANTGSRGVDVVMRDALPDDVRFEWASAGQGSCGSGQVVECKLGKVAAGQTARVAIGVTTLRTGSITNTATAATRNDPTGVSAVAVTEVMPPAEMVQITFGVLASALERHGEENVPAIATCPLRVVEGSDARVVLDAAVESGCLESWRLAGSSGILCINRVCDMPYSSGCPLCVQAYNAYWMFKVDGGGEFEWGTNFSRYSARQGGSLTYYYDVRGCPTYLCD